MDIKNKSIIFLGDSITAGGLASSEDKMFVKLISSRYGAKTFMEGISGTRIARQRLVDSENPYTDLDFYCRLKGDLVYRYKDPDVLVIFGGTNDFGHGDAPLGDLKSTSIYTFTGAFRNLLNYSKEIFPKSLILVVTPLHRLDENNRYGQNKKELSATLKEYVDMMLIIANEENVPVLNLFNDMDFFINKDNYQNILDQDGLHPNDCGHSLLADKIAKFIMDLIKEKKWQNQD